MQNVYYFLDDVQCLKVSIFNSRVTHVDVR